MTGKFNSLLSTATGNSRELFRGLVVTQEKNAELFWNFDSEPITEIFTGTLWDTELMTYTRYM